MISEDKVYHQTENSTTRFGSNHHPTGWPNGAKERLDLGPNNEWHALAQYSIGCPMAWPHLSQNDECETQSEISSTLDASISWQQLDNHSQK